MSAKPTIPLLVPPTIAAILDGFLTRVGQPNGYLSGADTAVYELNPLAHYLLTSSPIVFALGVATWIFVFNSIIALASAKTAAWIWLLLCGAHLIGASTWIIHLPVGILWVLTLWLFARLVVFPSYERRIDRLSFVGTVASTEATCA